MGGSSFLSNSLKMNRLLKYLALKSLALPSARITKLDNQGFSGEVYSLDSEKEKLLLKFYRPHSKKTAAKERQIYRLLSDSKVPVPKLYLADLKGEIVGRPFLMMQRLEGERFSRLLRKGRGREFVEALALSLHKLHSIDVESLGLDLPQRGFKEEVSDVKTIAGVFLSFAMAPMTFRRTYKALMGISNLNVQGNPPALLHGDCGPDNVVYSSGTVYLIDLESAYLGDPAYDLAYVYHGIRLGAHSKPELAGDFVEAYENLHGKMRDLETYKRLAALKIAVLIKFIFSFNVISLLLIGFGRMLNLLAGGDRRHLASFIDYCITYAEKGEAEQVHLH